MTESAPVRSAANPDVTACSHCGLPVPPARRNPAAETQFCCAGCEAVWQILHECSLDDYYRLRDAYGETNREAARISGKSFQYLDDPDYLAKFGEPRTAGGMRVQFYLEGVHCIACSWLVEKILLEREGALYARLDTGKAVLEIVFNPATVALSRIARTLDGIGYTPHPYAPQNAASAQRKETRKLLTRLGIAAASAMNIMLLAVSQYAGDATGIEPGYSALFRWVSLGLCIPAVLYSAWPYYRGAWSGLRRRMLHMDLPISLGILSAFSISVIATIQNRGDVYYDSVSVLIALLLAGRLLLQRASRLASDAGESLLSLAPRTVHRMDGEILQDVLLSEIHAEDRMKVLPGETIPVDGRLESESGWVSEAHLTGEPALNKRRRGDLLYAGGVVGNSPLEIVAVAVGETTRIARLAEMMRTASARRAPIVSVMDHYAVYFVGGVIFFAAATAVLWWFIDPSRILWNVAALMVVACPCALGLATPVALAVAMGRAAHRGIFIKGQDGVERLASVNRVILDKTGTLTEGELTIVNRAFADYLAPRERAEILAVTAALERQSGHIMALAFRDVDAAHVTISACRVIPGAGIEGQCGESSYLIGSEALLKERKVLIPESLQFAAREAMTAGYSLACVARQKECVAVYALGDRLREDSVRAVQELRRLDVNVELLSGDHAQATEHIARRLNVEQFEGSVSPEQKLARVEELIRHGERVAMAGDGVNDAAALSRATVGISAAGAAEVARDAADVFISSARGPLAIADALKLSRRAMKVIRINLVIALVYNLFGATLAISGAVSPLFAAILMPISSLTVLLIASRA